MAIAGFEPDGSHPFISGNLVAWEVWHEDTKQHDICAYNIATGASYTVAETSSDETLIGVDGSDVAYLRTDYTFPASENADSGGFVRNVFLYDVTATVRCHPPHGLCTKWVCRNVRTVSGGDFAGGLLAWNEAIFAWQTSPAHWSRTSAGVDKYEVGKDTSKQQIVEDSLHVIFPPSVSLDMGGRPRIVWQQRFEQRSNIVLYPSDDTYYEGHLTEPMPVQALAVVTRTRAHLRCT